MALHATMRDRPVLILDYCGQLTIGGGWVAGKADQDTTPVADLATPDDGPMSDTAARD